MLQMRNKSNVTILLVGCPTLVRLILATNPLTELSRPFSLELSMCFKPRHRLYR